MPTPGLVSVIVVNWNGKDLVGDCLESLARQTYRPLEIIAVDNASTDGSAELIKERFRAAVRLVRSGRNTGFSGGVNAGLAASAGEFLAILNSDATAEPDWIEALVRAAAEHAAVDMFASKIYLAGRDGVLDNTGELISTDALGKGRGRLEKDTGQYDAQEDVLCPSGCAAFYRRRLIEKIGPFDDRFFLYAEDIDFGLRAQLAGSGCVFVPSAKVYHKVSSSAGVVSPLKAFYVERNRMWVALKHFSWWRLLTLPLFTGVRYFYHAYGVLSSRGPAYQYVQKFSFWDLVGVTLRAYGSTLVNLPYLLRERARLRKMPGWPKHADECLKRYGMRVREAALSELV